MSNIRNSIEGLASQFAVSVIDALRGASIDELLGVAHMAVVPADRVQRFVATAPERQWPWQLRPRRARQSLPMLAAAVTASAVVQADDIAGMIGSIVGLLEQHTDGLRAEQISEALGVEAKELPRPFAEALTQDRIMKTGQKRATTYFAGAGKISAAAARAAARSAAEQRREVRPNGQSWRIGQGQHTAQRFQSLVAARTVRDFVAVGHVSTTR